MSEPMSPSVGLGVIHLFCKPFPDFNGLDLVKAVKDAESAGVTVITVAMLGHKADLAVMGLAADMRELRRCRLAFNTLVSKLSIRMYRSPKSLNMPRACHRKC